MFDIVTIGEAVLDNFLLLDLASIKPIDHQLLCVNFGEKIPIENVSTEIGGSAANASVAAARLGLRSSFMSVLGKDLRAQMIIERLKKENVNIDLISQKDITTSASYILSFKGERTILTHHGIKNFDQLKMKKVHDIDTAWWYVAPLAGPSIKFLQSVASEIKHHHGKLAWNPGVSQIRKGIKTFKFLLPWVDILIINKEEADTFLGKVFQSNQSIKKLFETGPKIVIMTLGQGGALAYDGHYIYEVPPFPAKRIETTGAGDAFASTFVAAFHETGNLNTALIFASINAGSVIEKIGAQPGLLTRSAIEQRLAKHRGYHLEKHSSH